MVKGEREIMIGAQKWESFRQLTSFHMSHVRCTGTCPGILLTCIKHYAWTANQEVWQEYGIRQLACIFDETI